jgi:hypothetical protein
VSGSSSCQEARAGSDNRTLVKANEKHMESQALHRDARGAYRYPIEFSIVLESPSNVSVITWLPWSCLKAVGPNGLLSHSRVCVSPPSTARHSGKRVNEKMRISCGRSLEAVSQPSASSSPVAEEEREAVLLRSDHH